MKPSEIVIKRIIGNEYSRGYKELDVDKFAKLLDAIAEDIYYIKKNALFSSEAVVNPPKRREWEREKE